MNAARRAAQAEADARHQRDEQRYRNRLLLVKRGPTACAYRGYVHAWDGLLTVCEACGHNSTTHPPGDTCPFCKIEIRLQRLEANL